MLFKEFGSKHMPTIIFIHGGCLSWWSWKPQIDALQNSYHIITPIIDGHGDAYSTNFVSIKKSANDIINYIKENCNGKIFCICGLSLGAQITVEILSQEYEITEYAIIESALVYARKITASLVTPLLNLSYGLIKKRWYAKYQAKALYLPDTLFEDYYNDTCRMTKESLINFIKSNSNYPIPSQLCKTKAKALILVGEKELSIMKKSAELLHNTINGSTLKVIEKCHHGEISIVYPDKYIDLLKQFFCK